MIKVLWVSSVQMTEGQLTHLWKLFGRNLYIKSAPNVSNWNEILRRSYDCDVIAVAYALSTLGFSDVQTDKPIIRPRRRYIPTGKIIIDGYSGRAEPEFVANFDQWERVN